MSNRHNRTNYTLNVAEELTDKEPDKKKPKGTRQTRTGGSQGGRNRKIQHLMFAVVHDNL